MKKSSPNDPICETINLLLTESKNGDEDTRVLLILQTKTFFLELLTQMNPGDNNTAIIKSARLLFRVINESLPIFLKNKSHADNLDNLIMFFIQSPINAQLGQDISMFVLSFTFSSYFETPAKESFFNSIGIFFESPVFPSYFEASGGLFALWDLLLSEQKSSLCDLVFDKISSTIHKYFQSDATQDAFNFLLHVSKSITTLPVKNAPNAFQFIFALISNAKPDLLQPFIDFEGFANINKYIVEKNDPQLLVVYQFFRSLIVSTSTVNSGVSPVLGQLVDLIQIPELSSDIRYAATTNLFTAVKQFAQKEPPLQPHQLYTLALAFGKDSHSSSIFFDMCWYISQHFQCDMTAILPSLCKLFQMKTAIDYDITSLFKLIYALGPAFQPFSSMFFESLAKDVDQKQLGQFFNKYEFGLELFTQCFAETGPNRKDLFYIFVKCEEFITHKNSYQDALTEIISKPDMVQTLIDIFFKVKEEKSILTLLLNSIIIVAEKSKILRQALIEVGIVMTVRELNETQSIDATMIFDLFAVLTGKHFDFTFDAAVSSFLKSVDFLGQPPENINRLAFGQKHDDTSNSGRLCFPSILHKCNFTITSYFDMWICGQYAIDNWMKETGKTIDQFPSILSIARRFLLPHHVPQICCHPRLFADACDDTFGLLPLFEFPKGFTNSQIVINLPQEIMSSSSMAFWFFLKDFPASIQKICTFHSIVISATADELSVNDQVISYYSSNRWYNIAITVTEKGKVQLYLDGKIMKVNVRPTFSPTLTFGAIHSNNALWFIGGAIRLYQSVIKEELILDNIRKGVSDTIAHGTLTITPSDYVELFDGFIPNASKSLSENSRPVLSFPLSSHIHTSYNGNRGLFKMILDYVADQKLDDCHYFLNALINLQMNNLSNWSRQDFALHISTLINIAPSLVDSQNFENVLKCFLINENFDWDALYILFLDFGLWNSELKHIVISKLFGYIAQYKPNKPSIIARFIFDAVHIVDGLDKEDISSLFALIGRLNIGTKTMARLVSSLPSFLSNFSSPSLEYDTDKESPYLTPMLNSLRQTITTKFKSYFCLNILPPVDAFDILYQVIPSSDYTLSYDLVMRFCITHCYIFRSWSCALSLLFKMPIDVEIGGDIIIKPTSINLPVLPYFIIMLGVMIPISVELPKTSDWYKLPLKYLEILVSRIDLIPVTAIDDNLRFSIVQLASFNAFKPTISLFPFAPTITLPDEIVDYASKPSQPFPQGEPQKCPIPGFSINVTTSSVPQTLNNLIPNIIPKHINLTHSVSTKTPLKDYDLEYCTEVLKANSKVQWTDWPDFLQSIRLIFGFDTYEVDVDKITASEMYTRAIQFISSILFKASIDPNMFSSLLSHVLMCGTSLVSSYSIALMQSVIINLLNLFTDKKLYSLQIVQFTCERIMEGWFSNTLLTPFAQILSLCETCDKPLPECFITLITILFEIIPTKDFPQFINYFVTYQFLIFSKNNVSNPTFCLLMLEKLIPRYSSRPKVMKNVLTLFCHAMRTNEELQTRWTKNIIVNHPDCDLKAIISGLMILADRGDEKFNEWSNQNILINMDWNSLMTQEIDNFDRNYIENLKETLIKMSDDRISLSSSFFTTANTLLTQFHNDVTLSKAMGATMRRFERDRLMFSISYFLRLREKLLSKNYKFDIPDTDLLSMSLLSDPLYPTKRCEASPLIYTMPSFPGGNVKSVQPEMPEIPDLLPLMPSRILDLLSTPIPQFEDLSLHTKRQVKLSFSQILPLSDSFIVSLLSLIQDEFDSLSSVSILYGVEPILGALFRTPTHLFFVEGMRITEKGARFVVTTTPRILYTFYMSYFINGSFGPCSLFGAHPVIRVPLDALISCQEHYWLHKPTAVELNFIYGWNFILIPELVSYKQFMTQMKIDVDESLQHFPKTSFVISPLNSALILRRKDTAKLWADGVIDNYTYLCVLNKLSRRSFCDYTQYCVFPWVVSDYNTQDLENAPMESFRDLSLPMGQIGNERAPRFQVIYEDSGKEYFYGTHYMHLGVVLYFMFRIDPFCLFSIYLHRGWDHQNRLFYDVTESWLAAAYTSPADVKELIPQFYSVPEFLSNLGKLPLTTTTEGKSVADVRLGKWSESPLDFTHKMLHYLQCDRVSRNLNSWIDLIFGYKSRGDAAIEAKNLFHPLCYAKDNEDDDDGIDSQDQIERDAAVTCVINFGQCCFQLFKTPHIPINKIFAKKHLMSDIQFLISQKLNTASFKFPISDVVILEKTIMATSGVSCFALENEINVDASKLAIIATTNSPKPQTTILVSGNFLVSTCSIGTSNDGTFMAIGQREGSVTLYRLKYQGTDIMNASLVSGFPTVGTVSIIKISTPHFLLLAVSMNEINRIDIGTRRVLKPITVDFKINCIDVDEFAGLIVGGGYSQIAVWTVSGHEIIRKSIDSSVLTITVAQLPETVARRFFITGHQNGMVRFWQIDYEDNELILLKNSKIGNLGIQRIVINEDANRAIAVTPRDIYCYDYIGSHASDMRKELAMECVDCGAPLEKGSTNIKICSSCHRFFCTKCHPNEQILKISSLQSKVVQPIRKYTCPHCITVKGKQSENEL